MKIIAVIPARYASTRFPAKLMQDLGGKTVISRTYQAAVNTRLFDDVFVVTDSILIYDEIISNGGKAIMSVKEHESGSDRIAEAVENLDVDIVVNVQGDEPFINAEPLAKVLDVFRNDFDKKVDLASLMVEITDEEDIGNPNNVKVVTDQSGFALYFSRSVIPYPRDRNYPTVYYEHIGVYAFRKNALLRFTQWPITPLEAAEKIECLRYLENGIPLRMVLVDYMGVEIDTPEDLDRAAKLI